MMEDYVLYEELERSAYSTVYKGRMKGTINFVAVHCLEKYKRHEITNMVRIIHEVNHNNIVKFYEWYETTNHIWLIVELCTGGSLATVILQDKHLPESSIICFGKDLVAGLFHLHSQNIIFRDLNPQKILLDGPGVLKYADFSLSKIVGEDLDKIFEKNSEINNQFKTENEKVHPNWTIGVLHYRAPELYLGKDDSWASDLWSLGCVFYEMFVGTPPFVSDNRKELIHKIIYSDFPYPCQEDTLLKPSNEFLSLIGDLLKKDPKKRLFWPELVKHSFWKDELNFLIPLVGKVFPHDDEVHKELHKPLLTKKSRKRHKLKDNSDTEHSKDKSVGSDHQRSMPECQESRLTSFRLSSRPVSAEPVTSITEDQQLKLTFTHNSLEKQIENLTFHSSDLYVTSIIDNPKIEKLEILRWDSKSLSLPTFSISKWMQMSDSEILKNLNLILEHLAENDRTPSIAKRTHLIHYFISLANNSTLATKIVENDILPILTRQLKLLQTQEMKFKYCHLIALSTNNSKVLDKDKNINEIFLIFTELTKVGRLKQAILPPLGEIIYKLAKDEHVNNRKRESIIIPHQIFTFIMRCLRDGESSLINHYAAKIVENIATTSGQYVDKFLVNDVGLFLWSIFSHSTSDNIKVTAISALARLCRHSVQPFQAVIDKVGLTTVYTCMDVNVVSIQQSSITIFIVVVTAGIHQQRIIKDKLFMQKVLRFLENPSLIIRAKAFLAILPIIKNSLEMLLFACKLKLINHIERDKRLQSNSIKDNHNDKQQIYLQNCLELLTETLISMIPEIFEQLLVLFESVKLRKHPPSDKARQIKSYLPFLPVLLQLVTSHLFRLRVLNDLFITNLSTLLVYSKKVDCSEIVLDNNCGPHAFEFVSTSLNLVEAILQYPLILKQSWEAIVSDLFPALCNHLQSSNENSRAMCLQMFTDIIHAYLSKTLFKSVEEQRKVSSILVPKIDNLLFPFIEEILFDKDPVSSYGLRLLLIILKHHPNGIIEFQNRKFTSIILQILSDKKNNSICSTLQNGSKILNLLCHHKNTDFSELIQDGLVEILRNIITNLISEYLQCKDPSPIIDYLLIFLDTMVALLQYVTSSVRQALQTQKKNDIKDHHIIEQLLFNNRSLVSLYPFLIKLFTCSAVDIKMMAVKIVSQLIQLFGDNNQEAFRKETLGCYVEALKTIEPKMTKLLLRVIKLLLTSDEENILIMKEHGQELKTAIKFLAKKSGVTNDGGIAGTAVEVLNVLKDTET